MACIPFACHHCLQKIKEQEIREGRKIQKERTGKTKEGGGFAEKRGGKRAQEETNRSLRKEL